MPSSPLVPRWNPFWTITANRLLAHLTQSPYGEDWSVPNGYVTKTGIWLNDTTFLPYPSSDHRRLWWKYRFGVSQDDLRQWFPQTILFAYADDEDDDDDDWTPAPTPPTPWKFLHVVDFLYCVPKIPGQHWPDAHALVAPTSSTADLAHTTWHPLWHRTTRRGQPGWAYPALPGLFIADDPRFIPFNQAVDWTDGGTIGQWLAAILPQLDTVNDTWSRDPWVLWGSQLLLWHAMGIGYFTGYPASEVMTHGTAG